jgi:nifR3 family TIM-barrel protein
MPPPSVPRPQFPPPLRYGSLALASRYLLSPLAGYTNLPFRRVIRQLGKVGLATTDLVNARSLVAGNPKALELVETSPDDSPFAVQIFGSESAAMCEAARLLEQRGVDSIDINMGCPVDRITRTGGGAGLMCRNHDAVCLVRDVVASVRIPVTVKMRLGWDNANITAPEFAREFEQAGAAAIAIHGRTREQGFGGPVSLDGIRRVVEAVHRIPVIGNGDVRTVDDAAQMIALTGCHGVSIGRGALANPWIFRQLVEWEETGRFDPPGNFEDRLELLRRQFRYLEQLRGGPRAIVMFRRMGHWYLKSMRVPAKLRHQFQLAAFQEDFEHALDAIALAGPVDRDRDDALDGWHVPVPAGPVERW